MSKIHDRQHSSIEIALAKIDNWYNRPLGRHLLHLEKAQLAHLLSHLFGYHLVQLGGSSRNLLVERSPIAHRVRLSPEDSSRFPGPSICGDFYDLPLAHDSVDAILLPHVLEFVHHPRRVLEESYRALVPEGRILVIGFNPCSLWGICKLSRQLDSALLNADFHSPRKVKRWLSDLDFKIETCKTDFFRFPFKHESLLSHTLFLETMGQLCWPGGGAFYVIVAKKVVETLIPIRPAWAKKKLPVGRRVKVAEPQSFDPDIS